MPKVESDPSGQNPHRIVKTAAVAAGAAAVYNGVKEWRQKRRESISQDPDVFQEELILTPQPTIEPLLICNRRQSSRANL